MFKKDKPTPPTAMQIHLEVEKHVLMQSTWRQVTDEELPAALAALTEIIGKKTAAQPSMQRRLGIMRDGSAYVLALEIPADAIIGQPWHPSPNGPPQFTVCGFTIAKGLELLQGPLNPEAELTDRRRRYDEYQKAETAKRAAEARAIADVQAQRLNEEVERQKCHAGEWALLNSLERFAARLALAVESRDAGLAADLRKLVADRLAGADDDAEAWPRNPAWCTGLALEGLPPERRQALAMQSQGEREIMELETVPRDKLPSLRLMAGDSRTAVLAYWKQISRAVRRGASGKAA
ncbi:MAG: hypothetical protein WBP56_14460 [Polyangia bacterium]